MSKIALRGKYTVFIIYIIVFGILLSTANFVAKDVQPNNIISSLNNGNSVDFNFCLNFNTYGKDQIDTYNGTFTKDLVLDGTKTIDFKLPDNIKAEIYKLMLGIDIMSFPDILKVDGMSVTPPCCYSLKVTMNGKTKNIFWNDGFYPSMDENLPKDNVNFLKLVKYISDYIYNTEEYRNMPRANGGYD